MNETNPPVATPMNPMMAVMGDMFANLMVPAPPPMDFNAGIIPNFFHGVKLRQLEKASASQAAIAECNARATSANLSKVLDFLTFQARTADIFKEYEHRETVRKLQRDLGTEELNKRRLENQNLFYEGEIAKMEWKKREREFKEEYGDGTQPS